MAIDEKIYWWYFIPGALVFLPVIFNKTFFLDRMLLSLLIAFCIGFGIHMWYRLYYYIIVRFIPRKSMAFLDYRLKKGLRRKNFKPKDTNRIYEYFFENKQGPELSRVKKFAALLTLLGCVIIACGLGIIIVMNTKTDFLMKYYILFTVFAVMNFSIIWEHLGSLETMLIKSNLDTLISETKKNKLI